MPAILAGNATTPQWSLLMPSATTSVTIDPVDDQPMDALPRAYRVGLRLRALGADDALIADCLEVDADAIATLLDIGARKLAQIERAARSGTTRIQ